MSTAEWTSRLDFGILRLMARSFGGALTRKRDGRVFLRFKIDGKPFDVWGVPHGNRYLAFGQSMDLAESVLEEIRAEFRRGTDPLGCIAPYLRNSKTMSFEVWWDKFCERQTGRADKGQISSERARVLAGHKGRDYLKPILRANVLRLAYSDMEDLQHYLFSIPTIREKSVHHVLADVRTCLRWLERSKIIPHAPEIPHTSVPDHTPSIPTLEEQARRLAAIPEDARGFWLVRGLMGLRNAEAQRASTGDYRRGSTPATDELLVQGKGKKHRLLPVPVEVASWVREHRPAIAPAETPLFPNPVTGGRWRDASANRCWKAMEKATGLAHRKPNESLRHCFGTRRAEILLRDGKGREDVSRLLMEFMGHTSIESSRRYVKLASESLRGVLG